MLPTPEQWWRADVEDGSRVAPWGNDMRTAEMRANFGDAGTERVGSYVIGVSPFGCYDMAGNVREWLRDGSPDSAKHSVAGGSWRDPPYMLELSHVEAFNPAYASDTIGFRLVASPPDQK
jgi:formylglycine-generating enzyme required for sulfatase activity